MLKMCCEKDEIDFGEEMPSLLTRVVTRLCEIRWKVRFDPKLSLLQGQILIRYPELCEELGDIDESPARGEPKQRR